MAAAVFLLRAGGWGCRLSKNECPNVMITCDTMSLSCIYRYMYMYDMYVQSNVVYNVMYMALYVVLAPLDV